MRQQYLGATTYRGHDIAQFYSPTRVWQDIVQENKTKNFTSILAIGSPGSGKSSMIQTGVHFMHEATGYDVKWFDKHDVPNTIEIIDNLPQGKDFILVFDDVSLALKKIRDAKKQMDIMEALTEIRHPESGQDRNIILISVIHYLMAMPKMWRSQGQWKFYADLSGEDKQNLNQFTQDKYKRILDEFQDIVTSQTRRGKFTVALTNKRDITYETGTTKNPNGLRFGMVFDGIRMRFFVYNKEWCEICKQKKSMKKQVSGKAMVQDIKNEQGKKGLNMLRAICVSKGLISCYSNTAKNVFFLVQRLSQEYGVDWKEVVEELRKEAQIPQVHQYRQVAKEDAQVKRIIDESENITSNT